MFVLVFHEHNLTQLNIGVNGNIANLACLSVSLCSMVLNAIMQSARRIIMASTTFSVRLDGELLDTIKQIADRENRTVNQQIVYFVEKGLVRYNVEQEAIAAIDEKPKTNKKKAVM